MGKPKRGHRQELYAAFLYEVWVFVGAVHRAAILHNPEASRRQFLLDALLQNNDAVGHILFDAVPCQGSFAAFSGYDARKPALFQPGKQAPQFGAKKRLVRQAGEQRIDAVEYDAARVDLVDRISKPDEKPFEVVFPGLVNLLAVDVDVVDGGRPFA